MLAISHFSRALYLACPVPKRYQPLSKLRGRHATISHHVLSKLVVKLSELAQLAIIGHQIASNSRTTRSASHKPNQMSSQLLFSSFPFQRQIMNNLREKTHQLYFSTQLNLSISLIATLINSSTCSSVPLVTPNSVTQIGYFPPPTTS